MKNDSFLALLVVLAAGTALAAAPTAGARPAREKKSATLPQVLPFVHDDYAQALARARARKLPLFIDAWAPW